LKFGCFLSIAALTLGVSVGKAQGQDATGCKDFTLVRFPGSYITNCKDKGDDVFTFDNIGPKRESKRIEGEFHQASYNFPKTANKAQVVAGLHDAMAKAGYALVYDSGSAGDFTGTKGKTWIFEEVSGGGSYRQTILTEIALSQDIAAKPAATADSYASQQAAPKAAPARPDAAGCKDSPLIERFPGSYINECKDKPDESFTFENLGPTKEKKKLEGEFHQAVYSYPGTASKAQVVRNLNTALRLAGYSFLYDSGDYGDFTVNRGKTWIAEEVSGNGSYRQTVMFETTLTQDVTANAAALSNGLTTSGHTVVNGILFDTAKADLKPESAAALQEVVKLLQGDPKLKIYVVGHTDNVGQQAANVELSRQRAASVVKALNTQYGVAADRLQPFGAGPYAPVASNATEDGRTLNRRVELVKQ
jgi:outer membrane protein OmpA-like peptidoglycan-associated protein